MIDKNTIEQARKQLGSHNDDSQPLEWCVQNVCLELENSRSENERLAKSLRDSRQEVEDITSENERLKKHLVQANQEIKAMRKVIRKYKTS